jgi:citrate lyase beta subunit
MIFPNSRSILITPALKVDLYNKGDSCEADLFVIDFEDSIHLSQKIEARQVFLKNMHLITRTKGYSFRINSLNSVDGIRDILFLTDNVINVHYLMVSKVTTGLELSMIKEVFISAGMRTPKLISLIENSGAIINLDYIAKNRSLS